MEIVVGQSTSTITKMSVYTYMEGHLARPHRTAATNYPCKTPGSVLVDSNHSARKVRGWSTSNPGRYHIRGQEKLISE